MMRVEARARLDGEACGMRRQEEEEERGAREGEREASKAGSNTRDWGKLEVEESWDEISVLVM